MTTTERQRPETILDAIRGEINQIIATAKGMGKELSDGAHDQQVFLDCPAALLLVRLGEIQGQMKDLSSLAGDLSSYGYVEDEIPNHSENVADTIQRDGPWVPPGRFFLG